MQRYDTMSYQELTEKRDEYQQSIMIIRSQISQAGENACPDWLARAEHKKKEFGVLIQLVQSEKTKRLQALGIKFSDVFLEVCKESMSSDDLDKFMEEAGERFRRRMRDMESN